VIPCDIAQLSGQSLKDVIYYRLERINSPGNPCLIAILSGEPRPGYTILILSGEPRPGYTILILSGEPRPGYTILILT